MASNHTSELYRVSESPNINKSETIPFGLRVRTIGPGCSRMNCPPGVHTQVDKRERGRMGCIMRGRHYGNRYIALGHPIGVSEGARHRTWRKRDKSISDRGQ